MCIQKGMEILTCSRISPSILKTCRHGDFARQLHKQSIGQIPKNAERHQVESASKDYSRPSLGVFFARSSLSSHSRHSCSSCRSHRRLPRNQACRASQLEGRRCSLPHWRDAPAFSKHLMRKLEKIPFWVQCVTESDAKCRLLEGLLFSLVKGHLSHQVPYSDSWVLSLPFDRLGNQTITFCARCEKLLTKARKLPPKSGQVMSQEAWWGWTQWGLQEQRTFFQVVIWSSFLLLAWVLNVGNVCVVRWELLSSRVTNLRYPTFARSTTQTTRCSSDAPPCGVCFVFDHISRWQGKLRKSLLESKAKNPQFFAGVSFDVNLAMMLKKQTRWQSQSLLKKCFLSQWHDAWYWLLTCWLKNCQLEMWLCFERLADLSVGMQWSTWMECQPVVAP